MPEKLIFEKGVHGRRGYSLEPLDVPRRSEKELLPRRSLRQSDPQLPELNEVEVIRHFIALSQMNYHVDKGMYPLGSCTMKYNPKINEKVAGFEGFVALHPLQDEEDVQGALRIMYELGNYLCEIAGLKAISLQPAAGAHGELTGLLMIRAYHQERGDPRRKVILPDSAHGTNPASITISGYQAIQIRSNPQGLIDLEELKAHLDEDVAALMLTNPNTLGLFESQVAEISQMVHDVGALLYMDGANLNALLGITRPGDIGFDVVHFNLHKTFSTPHGGGGPGSGPVGVSERLVDFLPVPVIEREGDKFYLDYNRPKSIGRVSPFYGNFGVMTKAYAYIRMLGEKGLRRVSENAIINSNYLLARLKKSYHLPYSTPPMHEFVLSGKLQKVKGVRTLDIAKRLLDYGFHAPTIYFPLIVEEALMIEPTETEPKEVLDRFADAMIQIAHEAEENPDLVRGAPHTTPVSRLDEALAARRLNLRYEHQQ